MKIDKTTFESINNIIYEHLQGFLYPIDSFVEESISKSSLYKFEYQSECIGYMGVNKEELQCFYIKNSYFKYAAKILEKVIIEKGIKSIFVMTQDLLLSALVAEWDFDKEKCACWFSDSKVENGTLKLDVDYEFREAKLCDIQRIIEISGDFFDDIEQNIKLNCLFLLESNNEILACGIIEKNLITEKNVSIGMYVNEKYRNKGIGRTILNHLKELSYKRGYIPVAGCGYYNTLSRKSLESAGMIATSIGYKAILKGKEKLPLRTGNKPGELIV